MWAPADLFGPGLSAFTLLGKAVVSYFYEHLVVLAIAVLLVAGLIAASMLIGNRRRKRA